MSSRYIALPEGVSEKQFDKAIKDFRRILGNDNVLVEAEQLAPYTKIMMPVDQAKHTPSAAITPDGVEQIQAILEVCNRYKVPVWPISTGKNLGYGSAAPATRGQVVLDLKRMNRILEVDADLATALVEPGVSYRQMHDYLAENKIPLWLDPPGSSAVAGILGSALDRGVGYTPYGDHFLFSCGMEVVMANGEVLRTGMGSLPDSNTWQVFKWGYGPSLDGIFTQSNFGIVTKLGMWLLPQPPAFKPFMVRYPDAGDIDKIVETLRPLRIANIIPNAVVIAGALWEAATLLVKRSDYYEGTDTIPEKDIKRLMQDNDMGYWSLYAALYGSPEQIEVNWNIVKGAFAASGGEVLTEDQVGDNPAFRYRADLMRGDMNLQEFGLYNWRGGGGSIWFSPVAQARGSETLKQVVLAKKIMTEFGFDYVGEFIVGWRDMHHIIDLLFDRSDPEQMKNAYACFDKLLDEFAKRGYGTYRVNTAFMDKVAGTYGATQHGINQKIKKALDPNGIIAPGKSGIYLP